MISPGKSAVAPRPLTNPPARLLHFPVRELEPPDKHALDAAIGWLALGNFTEARAELAAIDPEFAHHPDVLEMRWAVLAHEQNWTAALPVAHALVRSCPDRVSGWLHFSYALRRVPEGGLEAAWNALLPASDKFPKEPTVLYNLACYACQMGQLEDARRWLDRALKAGEREKIKTMAMADEDLRPLWQDIRQL